MPPMMKKHDKGAKREKADFKSFRKTARVLQGYLPAIISAILLAVGGAVCTIIGPDRISDLTNTIKDGLMLGIDMRAGARHLRRACNNLRRGRDTVLRSAVYNGDRDATRDQATA